jgi:glyoxalase family protein
MTISGIHHITALASDPQRTLDFYTGVLGLRLVKRTVNFDAPDVYHLYFGDEVGTPGTIITFFPFVNAVRGKRGIGEISAVAFNIPKGSIEFWVERLSSKGIPLDGPSDRFGDQVIAFEDPDGMIIELVMGKVSSTYRHWKRNSVPEEFSIQGIHSATLLLGSKEPTDQFITSILGFRPLGQSDNRHRYGFFNNESAVSVDLVVNPDFPAARQSAGSVHHVAWRTADEAEQKVWRDSIAEAGFHVTEIVDRNYFHSIYFREPGNVLFEIATDVPGFETDEARENLGTHLKLPAWLEDRREKIERVLPPLTMRRS